MAALLDQTRGAWLATKFEQYVGLAYLKYMLGGTYDYQVVDSKRWSHVKQRSLRECFENNPEIQLADQRTGEGKTAKKGAKICEMLLSA